MFNVACLSRGCNGQEWTKMDKNGPKWTRMDLKIKSCPLFNYVRPFLSINVHSCPLPSITVHF